MMGTRRGVAAALAVTVVVLAQMVVDAVVCNQATFLDFIDNAGGRGRGSDDTCGGNCANCVAYGGIGYNLAFELTTNCCHEVSGQCVACLDDNTGNCNTTFASVLTCFGSLTPGTIAPTPAPVPGGGLEIPTDSPAETIITPAPSAAPSVGHGPDAVNVFLPVVLAAAGAVAALRV
ncbi:unnamed protein product [Durusdinium trenchii]|uniref:Uncharacterized protein n=1 Tax=Durusdinium trenchii TaxID=1381693 RepID=A0ABP0LGK3_9DINO